MGKDMYPLKVGPRNGTPQANHVHVLLNKGMEILLTMFPNLQNNLVVHGAHILSLTNDLDYYVGSGYLMKVESDLTTIACTRQLLEYEIRNEIFENYPQVIIRENTRATGLVISNYSVKGLRTIEGVKVLSGSGANSGETIFGDLVVDTTGRESQTGNCLEKLGYGRPEETVVNSCIGYSTCWFDPNTKQISTDDIKKVIRPTIIMTNPPLNPYMGLIILLKAHGG